MREIGEGSILRTRSIKDISPDGNLELGFSAPRGEVFVVVLLGVEPKVAGDNAVDVDKVMESLGYVKKEG